MNNHGKNLDMQQCLGERRYGLADVVMLSAAMCLSLVIWAALADAAKAGEWKSIIHVTLTLFLVLAALTRDPRLAITFRLLAGGWIVSTPYLLGISDIEPAASASLVMGILLIAVSIAEMMGVTAYLNRLSALPRWLALSRGECQRHRVYARRWLPTNRLG
jgi:hypothetical protein